MLTCAQLPSSQSCVFCGDLVASSPISFCSAPELSLVGKKSVCVHLDFCGMDEESAADEGTVVMNSQMTEVSMSSPSTLWAPYVSCHSSMHMR